MELGSKGIQNGSNELSKRLGKEFTDEARIENMQNYLKGLLGSAERKNG